MSFPQPHPGQVAMDSFDDDIMEALNVDLSSGSTEVDEITRLFGEQALETIPPERMHLISDKEKSDGLYDLHGVSNIVQESPELIQRKLAEIDMELARISPKLAYEEAQRQSASYVNSMRLRFLRAERFDATKAATRMTRHFDRKREYFGRSTLGRDLTLRDLSTDERKALDSGYLQVLSHRDRGGRAILIVFGKIHIQLELVTSLKLGFFMHTKVSEDEEIQKKGAILIYYGIGQTRKKSYDRSLPIINCMLAVPLLHVGIHHCHDNPIGKLLVALFAYAVDTMYLTRYRIHSGSHVECQYSLMTFGIPIDIIPLNADGSIDTIDHGKWLQSLEYGTEDFEDGKNTGSLVVLPGPSDVLMGRGQRKAAGNRRFRKLLEDNRDIYDAAGKFEKNAVALTLFRLLSESGTRFLKQTDAGWVQIEDDLAIDKISHGFRNLRVTTK